MEIGPLLLGVVTIAGAVAVAIWVLKTLFDADLPSTERLIWLLIILMFPLVGAFIWLSWGQDSLRRRLDPPRRSESSLQKQEATH